MHEDEDSLWKEVLDRYFEEFLRFFFPSIHRRIDWRRDITFFDKELQRLAPEDDGDKGTDKHRDRRTARGRRTADKAVSVFLRNGKEACLLLHVEVEGQPGPDFPERMYIYNCRLFNRFRKRVVSLAVLPHAGGRYQVMSWGHQLSDFELSFRFPAVKFFEYRGREKELEEDRNPFALVVLAYLRRRRALKDPRAMLAVKRDVVRMLYERGYTRYDVMQLFRFLDGLLQLPQGTAEGFEDWLAEYERKKSMPYITSIERSGIERGRKEGHKEGCEQTFLEAIGTCLDVRFGEEGPGLLERFKLPADIESLRCLHRRVLEAKGLEEAAAVLEESSAPQDPEAR
jgi:hypothetical protein